MFGKNDDNVFVELAKVKSEPTPIKLDIEPEKKMEAKETKSDIDEETEGQLTVDVFQDNNDIVVQSTVAGINPENLEINITNESVTIRGARERQEIVEEKDYFYQECFWGKFSRSIILPQEVDPDNSVASLKNGVLTIRMPKLNRQKAKKLKVKLD